MGDTQWQIDEFAGGWLDKKANRKWWRWGLHGPRSRFEEVRLIIYPEDQYILDWPIRPIDVRNLDRNIIDPLVTACDLNEHAPEIDLLLCLRHRDGLPQEVEAILGRDEWQLEVNHTAIINLDLTSEQDRSELRLLLDQDLVTTFVRLDILPEPHESPDNPSIRKGKYSVCITNEPKDITRYGYVDAGWSTDLKHDLTPAVAQWMLGLHRERKQAPTKISQSATDLCALVNQLKLVT